MSQLVLYLLIFHELIATSLTGPPLIGEINWILISQLGTKIERPEECDKLAWLSTRQRQLCKWEIDHMETIRNGAKLAMTECEKQFKFRRWNCSTIFQTPGRPILRFALQEGTREAAFVYAISSAGVAYAVTKACKEGSLGSKCSCDDNLHGDSGEGWNWSGCSEDVSYGIDFSTRFVESRGQGFIDQRRKLMNKHNNGAGRLALEDNMSRECKCHGVSGSCNIRTCWRVMPPFSKVGDILKEKFDGATEVKATMIGKRMRLVAKNGEFKPHTSRDLVYLDPSPDFCLPNNRTGSFGTRGRLCNKTSQALDGCELMCCGRGTVSQEVVRREQCNCEFHWCCHVRCDTCKKKVEEHYCK